MIEDTFTYWIEIRGPVDLADINATSPLQLTPAQGTESRTVLTACTDQSGLIGLIRYLHNLGFIILSIRADVSSPKEPGSAII